MIFFASAHIHQALLILFLVNLLACGGNKSTSTELQKSEDITDEKGLRWTKNRGHG